MIFSFLLFLFAVYIRFFSPQNTSEPKNTSTNIEQNNPVVTIQPYKEIHTQNTNTGTNKGSTGNNNPEEIQTKIINALPTHQFTRAFLKNETNEEIGILQEFLKEQLLYTGNITNTYDPATRDAVYEFQRKTQILSPSDPVGLRGYFGPSTRTKVNTLMPQ
ncbi:MAG: peptidoglycan-binding protein [bacterium]|nr:peptidoglycan-binding protein [bacterium]